MRHHYSSDFADFKMAQRTYIRSSGKRRFCFHFQMWGMLLLGLTGIVIFSQIRDTPAWLGTAEAAIVGGLTGGGACCLLSRWWILRRTYKAYGGEIKGSRAIYFEVEGEQLISGIDDKSEGRFNRAGICDSCEDDDMLLLFVAKKRFLYLPKKRLPPELIQEVHTWLLAPGRQRCT